MFFFKRQNTFILQNSRKQTKRLLGSYRVLNTCGASDQREFDLFESSVQFKSPSRTHTHSLDLKAWTNIQAIRSFRSFL